MTRDKLIEDHMWLVRFFGSRFSKQYRLDAEDLESCGYIGLIEAADRYNPQLPNKFSTYARFFITGRMMEYISNQYSLISIPETTKRNKVFFTMSKIVKKITGTNEFRALTPDEIEEIASEMDINKNEVEKLWNAMLPSWSLNAKHVLFNDEEIEEVQDIIPVKEPSPEELAVETMTQEHYKKIIDEARLVLDDREQIVLDNELSDEPLCLRELASKLGCAKSTAHVVRQSVLKKLKEEIGDNYDH